MSSRSSEYESREDPGLCEGARSDQARSADGCDRGAGAVERRRKGARARAIHAQPAAAAQRFSMNCAASGRASVESGSSAREGSFTGATEKQIGKFEQADRGTELSRRSRRHEPETQAKVI